jgi:hypothetical protein
LPAGSPDTWRRPPERHSTSGRGHRSMAISARKTLTGKPIGVMIEASDGLRAAE